MVACGLVAGCLALNLYSGIKFSWRLVTSAPGVGTGDVV